MVVLHNIDFVHRHKRVCRPERQPRDSDEPVDQFREVDVVCAYSNRKILGAQARQDQGSAVKIGQFACSAGRTISGGRVAQAKPQRNTAPCHKWLAYWPRQLMWKLATRLSLLGLEPTIYFLLYQALICLQCLNSLSVRTMLER